MIKLTLLNHGLQNPLTRTSSPSYTSQVMRIYNLDYVLSVRNELPKEPADIPPFKLIVDNLKWKVGKNRTPP